VRTHHCQSFRRRCGSSDSDFAQTTWSTFVTSYRRLVSFLWLARLCRTEWRSTATIPGSILEFRWGHGGVLEIAQVTEILAAIRAEDESETNDVKAARFANELFEVLHNTIPTAFAQNAFERSTVTVRSAAAKVRSRLPDFELRDQDLEKALVESPRALSQT
jgi:hypothetical protein